MDSAPDQSQVKIPWFLIFILLASTTINYVDRIAISVLAPTLRDEFAMSNSSYAWVVNSFQFGYLIFYSVGGRLADRWGFRLALTVYVLWWSRAGMLHAFATGAVSLAIFRLLLAVGEGGTWPTALKAVAQSVPGPMRSFTTGIVNSGAAVGAMIAPPLVGWLALNWGWRAAFLATGSLGLIWLPFWRIATARSARALPDQPAPKGASWLNILKYKQAWAVAAARCVGDPMYTFYLFWLPEYLTRERGMDLSGIAMVAWIPFLAADIGNLVGGGITSWLIARGWSAQRARGTIMWATAIGTVVGMAVPFVESTAASIAILALTCMLYMTWSVNVMILPSDWFASENVGTVLGLSGTGNGIGGLIGNAVVGRVLDRTGSYRMVFVGVGCLVVVAQTLLTLIGGKIERLDDRESELGVKLARN